MGVEHVVGHMCQFGMTQDVKGEVMYAKKTTAFLTNASGIASRLRKTCDDSNRNVSLIGGRAKQAKVYPDELCKSILRGLVDQIKWTTD